MGLILDIICLAKFNSWIIKITHSIKFLFQSPWWLPSCQIHWSIPSPFLCWSLTFLFDVLYSFGFQDTKLFLVFCLALFLVFLASSFCDFGMLNWAPGLVLDLFFFLFFFCLSFSSPWSLRRHFSLVLRIQTLELHSLNSVPRFAAYQQCDFGLVA